MFKPENNGTEFNFWPSIADTLLAIFMVFLMLWLAEKIIFLQQLGHIKAGNEALTQKLAESNKELEDSNKESTKSAEDLKNAQEIINEIMQSANSATLGWQKCEGEKQVCEKEKKRLIEEKARLSADLKSCERLQDKTQLDALRRTERQLRNSLLQCESDKARYLRDKPPIINLPETLGFSFNTGQAQLSERFENRLKNDIVSKLREIKNKHNVNVIEVIGHTDGVIAGGNSNLDGMLENAVARGDISGLRYGSNADLGLMRALAVAFFLRKQPELRGVKFRVYSAAQLILADGKLTNQPNRTKDDARRRIELRFTHLED
jgi:flagellar motor protein MotB